MKTIEVTFDENNTKAVMGRAALRPSDTAGTRIVHTPHVTVWIDMVCDPAKSVYAYRVEVLENKTDYRVTTLTTLPTWESLGAYLASMPYGVGTTEYGLTLTVSRKDVPHLKLTAKNFRNRENFVKPVYTYGDTVVFAYTVEDRGYRFFCTSGTEGGKELGYSQDYYPDMERLYYGVVQFVG